MRLSIVGGRHVAALMFGAGAMLQAMPVGAQAPVKIGFLADLSGPLAAPSQDMFDGFMLVVERNGGKLGGTAVEVIKEDSQLKPDVGNQAARKLVEKDGVSFVTGITASNVMLAVHKYITDKQVFLIGSNAGPSQIAGVQCSPFQFMVSWQGDQASEALGRYATDKGFKRVLTLAPGYQAGKDSVAGFKRYFKGELVDELYTPLTQMDFSSVLTQVAATQPDAVYAFYPGGLGIAFVKQYQQAGLLKKVPLLTTYIADATTLPSLRDSAVGMLTGGFWGPDFANAANKRFVGDFERKYKRMPSNYAAQSYDAAQLIDSALARVKGNVADKQALSAALAAADFSSVRGAFKFNHNHFPIHDMHAFEVVKAGDGAPTLRTVATPLKQAMDAYHEQCPMK
jgi:branched-chain amino acid transport system substrate-binding protein